MTPGPGPKTQPDRFAGDGAAFARQMQRVMASFGLHASRMLQGHGKRLLTQWGEAMRIQQALSEAAAEGQIVQDAQGYGVDAFQRAVLTLDTLRQRGNNDIKHEAEGTPPVQIYESETVLDGRDLPRPANYVLLRIKAPEGVVTYERKRPYIIVDPRAGHGAGIGAFKPDSQVGVALRHGHPVYSVIFRQHPEPGQTLADVMRAEAAFVHEVRRRHPDAAKPIVVGNCQGGWAVLLLAAANPEITGPLVVNGAPVAAWSGRPGESPMRYNGGLLGGIVPALFLSDLGNGEFDGAHLVANFEALNPGRNFFGKYYDLYAHVDTAREKFLRFERWWGGFHFLNEAEIRWILEQIFIGNRLSRGEARIEHGRTLDLKQIRSPIIVFASRGDNITPPAQALNWILDTYDDEDEIKICGQRIVYMVHDKVGHLGIFVSSSIARKEHQEVTSTLRRIEALSPGLYEMRIEGETREGADTHFLVSFHERKLSDLTAIDEGREDERDFAAVARLSELGAEVYDLAVRPMVKAVVTPPLAEILRRSHPMRMRRNMFSDENPLMHPVRGLAERAMQQRKPAAPGNPFLALEKWWASAIIQGMDMMSDIRDAAFETTFLAIYGSPLMHAIGASHVFERPHRDRQQLRAMPEVEAIMLGIERGGFPEAVIRMLILLAGSRGSVRHDRLERSARLLAKDEPFASLGPERRAAIIREQSIIAKFEPERAIQTLPALLPDLVERQRAIEVVEYIAGSIEEMEPRTVLTLQQFHEALGFPTLLFPRRTQDPLIESAVA